MPAAFSFRMNADLCKSGYRGAFRVGKKVASGLPVFFVLARCPCRLKLTRSPCRTAFFLSSHTLRGFWHCELASIAGMPDPLDCSFISARGLPGKGAALPAWGREGVGTCLVTRPFCAKLAVQAFCSSPPGGIPCHPLRLVWRLFAAAIGRLSGQ